MFLYTGDQEGCLVGAKPCYRKIQKRHLQMPWKFGKTMESNFYYLNIFSVESDSSIKVIEMAQQELDRVVDCCNTRLLLGWRNNIRKLFRTVFPQCPINFSTGFIKSGGRKLSVFMNISVHCLVTGYSLMTCALFYKTFYS